MPSTTADTIVDVADRLFSAIENSDMAAVDRLWSDDIAVWRVGTRRDNEKARALRVVDWFITATTERHYEILDLSSSTADPSAASSSNTSCTPPGMPANRSPCGSAS
jgi:hypothetical protein